MPLSMKLESGSASVNDVVVRRTDGGLELDVAAKESGFRDAAQALLNLFEAACSLPPGTLQLANNAQLSSDGWARLQTELKKRSASPASGAELSALVPAILSGMIPLPENALVDTVGPASFTIVRTEPPEMVYAEVQSPGPWKVKVTSHLAWKPVEEQTYPDNQPYVNYLHCHDCCCDSHYELQTRDGCVRIGLK